MPTARSTKHIILEKRTPKGALPRSMALGSSPTFFSTLLSGVVICVLTTDATSFIQALRRRPPATTTALRRTDISSWATTGHGAKGRSSRLSPATSSATGKEAIQSTVRLPTTCTSGPTSLRCCKPKRVSMATTIEPASLIGPSFCAARSLTSIRCRSTKEPSKPTLSALQVL